MARQLINAAVVIAAQHFNPSVTGQHWLIKHGIIREEELQVGALFTDLVVQVPTRDFRLQVIPENCQFAFRSDINRKRQRELIEERMGEIVRLLPHTPYTGVGLNFLWHFFPDSESVAEVCRRLFFSMDKPLLDVFNTEDARFGGYMSMNWGAFRLRLEVKPVYRALPEGQQSETVQFAFNFHHGVAGRPEPSADIIRAFAQWDAAWDESVQILQKATGEQ